MGDYLEHTRAETFLEGAQQSSNSASEDVARLQGCRLIVASEPNSRGRLNESLLKRLTGEDKIVARELYKASTTFTFTGKIWILLNEMPIWSEHPAMMRRLKYIYFNHKIGMRISDRFFFRFSIHSLKCSDLIYAILFEKPLFHNGERNNGSKVYANTLSACILSFIQIQRPYS